MGKYLFEVFVLTRRRRSVVFVTKMRANTFQCGANKFNKELITWLLVSFFPLFLTEFSS